MPAGVWLGFARAVLHQVTRGADPRRVPAPDTGLPEPYAGVFVTLHKFHRLRGCMGTLDARGPLAEAIREATRSAAQLDPRFEPVQADELIDLTIEISVLSSPCPMQTLDDLVLGRHGILVQRGAQRGLFLPQVATEHRLGREEFLARCCQEKAGLPPDAWRDPQTQVLLFTTHVWSEATDLRA